MKVLVQWSFRNATGWVEIDSSQWPSLPSKPTPGPASNLNNQPGWIAGLCVQGIVFDGMDHYAIEELTDGSGGIVVTGWNTEVTANTPSDRLEAYAWTLLPLAPDPELGGQLNTRQSRVVHAAPAQLAMYQNFGPLANTDLRPYANFAPPGQAITRHGIQMADADWQAHVAARTVHGWREWSS